MRIAILSTSVTSGGAAVVTTSLANALMKIGHEVKLFTIEGNRKLKPSFWAERLGIFARNGFRRDSLFKVSMADFGECRIVDKVRNFSPDVIILGWINQGFLSLNQIAEISKIAKTYWVMHDMWNFTGICHHSYGCQHFTYKCGNCPMVADFLKGKNDLSSVGWKRKARLYNDTQLKFIAVSSWVKQHALRSSLLENADITVVPNVYPLDEFYIGKKEQGLIVWGAECLDNHIKGLSFAVDALNRLPKYLNAKVIFFGGYKDISALNELKIPYELTGTLSTNDVKDLLSRAQVVLSTALYETFGNTLLEGQASGAVPVSFNRGGQVDIIDHMKSGFLADFGDVEAIARGLEWSLTDAPSPEKLRQYACEKFGEESVAKRYETLLQ